MALVVRSSKFRHVFGTPYKKDKCYDSIKISKGPWESNMSDVNSKFLAVVLESQGGGAFLVCPLSKVGRFDLNYPKICGHKGNVLDLAWNPFNDNMLASSSEDCTIKIWEIPDQGLSSNLEESSLTLEHHQKKVGCISWHPTAENIIVSGGFDGLVVIWNISDSNVQPCLEIGIPDAMYCLSWNNNGSLLCLTCKDKMLRILDPRKQEIVSETEAHQGRKASKAIFCDNYIFSTGFTKNNERQYSLWDPQKFSKPLHSETIDSASGCLNLFYDPGTKMVYTVGKGDSQQRYFEISENKVHYLSMFQRKDPVRGACAMPKRHLNFMDCEVMRFYNLDTKGLVEPVSFKVPRKSAMFQDDIYPPCFAGIPSQTADEWLAGETKDPMVQKITKDGLGAKSGGGVSTSKLTLSASGTSGQISKQSSISSSASDLKIERENSPSVSLTASGDFDDSAYKKEIESLKAEVNALRQENASLKNNLKKKESIISDIKQLIN